MSDSWGKNILEEQPRRGQRVLVKLLGGQVRITTYDQYAWENWCIREWRPMPDNFEQQGHKHD